jgi:hypothetical protein
MFSETTGGTESEGGNGEDLEDVEIVVARFLTSSAAAAK